MKIAVLGLGHVGLVTAIMFAEFGHSVLGVDVDPHVKAEIREGRAPFHEPGLDALVAKHVANGRLYLTDAVTAVTNSETTFVCVGTPAGEFGAVDLAAITRVIDEIGVALRAMDAFYPVIVLRSTLPPNQWQPLVQRLEQVSGREAGVDFGVCANPEFLREGRALEDFQEPPFVVLGARDRCQYILQLFYEDLQYRVLSMAPEEALLLKYASNAWHALKVAFANEISAIANSMQIDGRAVMAAFVQDTQLNISPAYLKPGGPYGGACLPKDVQALTHLGELVGVPLINAIEHSNEAHIRAMAWRALRLDVDRIAVVGLSFKPGTSDIRHSPATQVIDTLIEAGREVRIYDPDVPAQMARGYAPLLAEWETLADWAEAWVICKPEVVKADITGEVLRWI